MHCFTAVFDDVLAQMSKFALGWLAVYSLSNLSFPEFS